MDGMGMWGDAWGKGGKDMWGAGGAAYGWGPWAGGGGKGGCAGPYGKGAPSKPKPAQDWEEKPKGPHPEVVMLSIPESSTLMTNGFPSEGPGIVYDKSYDIFSEADHILWQ